MRSSARVNVIGHLGADAELSFLTSGDPILAFRVAHTPPREGQPEHTNWYRCTLLGRRAEALQPYLVTGMPVFVHGDLDVREGTAPRTPARRAPASTSRSASWSCWRAVPIARSGSRPVSRARSLRRRSTTTAGLQLFLLSEPVCPI
jgi:hypothetical protein